ncbi:MAG TPA: polysaccharide deacetylase family protein [Prolixibacteraceae bacterium]|jgi:peptidoglycan/xylan/chitin deacetylase (PgdA/CDA1 family)
MSSQAIKHIISKLSGIIPIEKLPHGHRFILPFWHAVSDASLPHLSQLYRVQSTSEFERTLDFLLKNYKPASANDVLSLATTRGKQQDNFFYPSFDDGLSECYQVVAPMLKRKGIQAAFFINPLFVDNKTLFHRHKASLILNSIHEQKSKASGLKKANELLQQRFNNNNLYQFLHQTVYTDHWLLDQIAHIFDIDFANFCTQHQPYMTLVQIKDLQKDGFLIGAHGMDHREFFLSSEEEIMDQISSSMDFLMQQVNPAIKTFAFPYTDFNVADAIFERANNEKLWDVSFGTAGIKDETMPNHLQRIPMESSIHAEGKTVIRTEYMWYYLKTVFGKNKVSRQ